MNLEINALFSKDFVFFQRSVKQMGQLLVRGGSEVEVEVEVFIKLGKFQP